MKEYSSQKLKGKIQKLEQELLNLQEKKEKVIAKEKKLIQAIKETKADYFITLMSESGKTIEEVENFINSNQQSSF